MTQLPRFSANLGFLWTELALPEAIKTASAIGFDAVECHWPYDFPAAQILETLQQSGIPMLGLNTRKGDTSLGGMGLAAITNCESQAQEVIHESIEYANAIGCQNIHVMAGNSNHNPTSQETYQRNLQYACEKAAQYNKTILIEPLNPTDAPNYHLSSLDLALTTISELQQSNLKIMYDCYHIQRIHGNLLQHYSALKEHIGHIQFAAVHDRGEPDLGEVNYPWLFNAFAEHGYDGYFGAEYKPRDTTDSGLGWLKLPQ